MLFNDYYSSSAALLEEKHRLTQQLKKHEVSFTNNSDDDEEETHDAAASSSASRSPLKALKIKLRGGGAHGLDRSSTATKTFISTPVAKITALLRTSAQCDLGKARGFAVYSPLRQGTSTRDGETKSRLLRSPRLMPSERAYLAAGIDSVAAAAVFADAQLDAGRAVPSWARAGVAGGMRRTSFGAFQGVAVASASRTKPRSSSSSSSSSTSKRKRDGTKNEEEKEEAVALSVVLPPWQQQLRGENGGAIIGNSVAFSAAANSFSLFDHSSGNGSRTSESLISGATVSTAKKRCLKPTGEAEHKSSLFPAGMMSARTIGVIGGKLLSFAPPPIRRLASPQQPPSQLLLLDPLESESGTAYARSGNHFGVVMKAKGLGGDGAGEEVAAVPLLLSPERTARLRGAFGRDPSGGNAIDASLLSPIFCG